MATRVQQITVAGAAVAALLLTLSFGTLGAVISRAEGFSSLSARDLSAVTFTLKQAFLSALISVLLAIPVARALARRDFVGRSVLITLLGAPFILPVIVAILGLLSVFGRNGLLNGALGWMALEPIQIYGQHGVILAHVFFNLPLATRLILQGWLGIPAERFRLAASLGMGPREIFRQIELPMLRQIAPGCFVVIFMICTTSFAVALTLGGGPKATTIELAIYQAFRFDFDLSKAAILSVMQFAICAVLALGSLLVALPSGAGAGLDRMVDRWDGSRVLDTVWIGIATLFLLVPLGMIIAKGLPELFELRSSVFVAAWRSVWVALSSALLAISLSLVLAFAIRASSGVLASGLETVGYLAIAASPLVIGTGLFLLVYRWADPVALALPVTVLVNAIMSVPFALRALLPAIGDVQRDYGRLSASLGLGGWALFRIVYLPRITRPLGFAAGLAAALSMGDLGVIALFADPESATLPLEMYRLMEAYRMEQAFSAALVLLTLTLALFWMFDRGGRVDVDR